MLTITWESPGLRQHRGVMIKDSRSLHEAEESSETCGQIQNTHEKLSTSHVFQITLKLPLGMRYIELLTMEYI